MSHLLKNGFHLRASNEMILARFIVSMGFAIVTVSTSVYMRSIGLSDSFIGIFSGSVSAFLILLSPLFPIILEKISSLKIYVTATVMLAGVYVALGSITTVALALSIFIVGRIIISILNSAASLAFKSTTHTKREYTQAQGLASSLINLGWVLGPLSAGYILDAAGAQGAFYVGAGVMVLGPIVLKLYPIRIREKHHKKIDSSWTANLRFYMSRINLIKAYLFRINISIWWAFLWTFVPLFMLDAGYSLSQVGLVTAATQVPLFLFEFKTVNLIKPLGYRKIFAMSYGLMSLVMIIAIGSGDLTPLLVGYVVASLGLAFLEPISEIYLYDQVTPMEEERVYPIYITGASMGSIIGRLGIGLIIGTLGITFGYGLILLFTTAATLTALTLKN